MPPQPQPQPQPPAYAPEPLAHVDRIGDILRRVREKRGDDLGHIAQYLCIRRSYLDAIENSDYEKFPADAYVIGFLRSYAELLGLDGKEAINLYRAEMAGQRKKTLLVMPTPIAESRSPSVFILIGAAVTAILVYVLWYGLSSSDRATVSAPPPLPAATSSAPSSVPEAATVPTVPVVPVAPAAPTPAPVAESATPQAAPAPEAAKSHIVIRAAQSSWILITNKDGQAIFDRVLKPGETYKVPDDPGLTLTTGNGGGVVIALDGVDLPKLSSVAAPGPSGIIRDIPLDTARLKALAKGQ